MITLNTAQMVTLVSFGRKLLNQYRTGMMTFETASQTIVEAIYQDFREPDGIPTFALVRVFRLCRFNDLPPDAHNFIQSRSEGYWMALAGTAGDEAMWNDRQQATFDRILFAGSTIHPMLEGAFKQLDIVPGKLGEAQADAGTGTLLIKASLLMQYFHVLHAAESAYVSARQELIDPYHIESLVGIGTPFRTGSAYLLVCYSRVQLPTESARKFAKISPFVSALLDGYDSEGKIWN